MLIPQEFHDLLRVHFHEARFDDGTSNVDVDKVTTATYSIEADVTAKSKVVESLDRDSPPDHHYHTSIRILRAERYDHDTCEEQDFTKEVQSIANQYEHG